MGAIPSFRVEAEVARARLFRIIAAAIWLFAQAYAVSPTASQTFETTSARALMIDVETGTVLFSKEPDTPFPPGSLAKLMTVEMIFHTLKEGQFSFADQIFISENAWRTGGAPSGTTTMFAEVNSSVPLDAILQGIIVQYANDACIAFAENMAGSEASFAQMLNQRARELNLGTIDLANATGLPTDGQQVTARSLTNLAVHLWREYPEFYHYFSQEAFEWNRIFQRNRNPLLRLNIGVDGLGIGYAEEAGYAITVSAVRNGRRLFATLSGLETEAERVEEARKMLDWGFNAFEHRQIVSAAERVGEVNVYGGEKKTVSVRTDGPIFMLAPRGDNAKITAQIIYDGPVPAPIREGERIGTLQIWNGDMLSREAPLFAAEAIEQGTLRQRAVGAVRELLVGWLR